MNQIRIFYGTAGFLVENIDKETKEELLTYLGNEGFSGTKYINLPKTGLVHVNIESMRYGLSILGIKMASNNFDEMDHPFTVHEFKTIWNTLKKHENRIKRVDSDDRKYLDSGCLCFLVRDECLKSLSDNFWNYLEEEKFKALTENDTPPDWVLINVGNSTYINLSDNEEIISYVDDNQEDALTVDEFKTIWEVIRKHR